MSNLFDFVRKLNVSPMIGIVLLSSFLLSGTAHADPQNKSADETSATRVSVSRHVVTGGRSNPVSVIETKEEYEALESVGVRNTKPTRGANLKPGSATGDLQKARNDFWIFSADVELFNDDDHDGYFHGIDLLFDADTIYSSADVYAVVYLSRNLGPWNEYGITENFRIFGASADDEYVLITELLTGYPRDDYDLLIELFDAIDNSFVASFGPDDSSELSLLPLEDFDRDEPVRRTYVAVGSGGGGSADMWTIGLLLLLLVGRAARKIWRHRNDALVRIDSPAPCWQDHSRSRRSL